MNARASFAVITVGLAAALLAGCTSSGGGSAASTTPPSTAATPPAAATTTVTAAAPSTGDAVAGASTPAADDDATSPAQASRTSTQGAAAHSGSGSYTAFIGTWNGHSRTLTVDKDGGVSLQYRTYRYCSSTVTTACDRTEGNSIIDGGRVRGMITHVYNASTVTVTVYSSTVTRDVPDTDFTLGHDIAHHALAIRLTSFTNAPFCGSGAPNGYCGA